VCVCSVDSATLSAAVRGLSPEQHVELRKTLDEVMKSVSSLKNEIAELREGLRDITTTIAEDVKCVISVSSHLILFVIPHDICHLISFDCLIRLPCLHSLSFFF